jgi:hypothetical protein
VAPATGPFLAVPDIIPVVVPPPATWPPAAVSWLTSVCISVMVTPDLFIVDPTNSVIAVASPVVPAVDCMEVPLIMPPPIMMAAPDILPSMVPSDASSAIAVTMPELFDIATSFAYWDIAALAIP